MQGCCEKMTVSVDTLESHLFQQQCTIGCRKTYLCGVRSLGSLVRLFNSASLKSQEFPLTGPDFISHGQRRRVDSIMRTNKSKCASVFGFCRSFLGLRARQACRFQETSVKYSSGGHGRGEIAWSSMSLRSLSKDEAQQEYPVLQRKLSIS